ncbi:MAG: HTH domain-containing protein, partial [Aggregatilineales bacterium]
ADVAAGGVGQVALVHQPADVGNACAGFGDWVAHIDFGLEILDSGLWIRDCTGSAGILASVSQFLQQRALTVIVEVSDMFGSKSDKQKRLQAAQQIIAARGEISPAELARQLGVPRSTVSRDLAVAEEHGVLLCEDERGRLSLLERWFGRRR